MEKVRVEDIFSEYQRDGKESSFNIGRNRIYNMKFPIEFSDWRVTVKNENELNQILKEVWDQRERRRIETNKKRMGIIGIILVCIPILLFVYFINSGKDGGSNSNKITSNGGTIEKTSSNNNTENSSDPAVGTWEFAFRDGITQVIIKRGTLTWGTTGDMRWHRDSSMSNPYEKDAIFLGDDDFGGRIVIDNSGTRGAYYDSAGEMQCKIRKIK